MKILNFGSLNLDYVYGVEHFVMAGKRYLLLPAIHSAAARDSTSRLPRRKREAMFSTREI